MKKGVAQKLSHFYEINHKLHKNKIEAWKSRYAINATVIMVDDIYKAWSEKKIRMSLLITIKKAFNHISWMKLAQ